MTILMAVSGIALHVLLSSRHIQGEGVIFL